MLQKIESNYRLIMVCFYHIYFLFLVNFYLWQLILIFHLQLWPE